MRILVVLGSDATGFSETFIRRNIDDLRKAGLEVIVLSGMPKGESEHVVYSGFNETSFGIRLWKLFGFVAEIQPDRYVRLGLRLRQQRASKRLKRIDTRGVDFVWFDYLTYAVYCRTWIQTQDIRYAVAVHGFDGSSSLSSYAFRKEASSLRPEFILVPSFHLKRRLQVAGIVEQEIIVAPYQAPVVSDVSSSVKRYDFVCLGRMVDKKCPIAAISAFDLTLAKFSDAKLIWVGSGPLMLEVRNRFQSLIDQGNLILHGSCDHAEALKIMSESRVFVQHSVTAFDGDQEGFPNSLIEAMTLGIPVVTTIHSGISEVVVDGKSGYLVQEHDFVSMSQKMNTLLSDSVFASQMGENGRRAIGDLLATYNREEIIKDAIQKCIPMSSKK